MCEQREKASYRIGHRCVSVSVLCQMKKNFDMMDIGVGTNMRDSFPLLSEDEGLDPS